MEVCCLFNLNKFRHLFDERDLYMGFLDPYLSTIFSKKCVIHNNKHVRPDGFEW